MEPTTELVQVAATGAELLTVAVAKLWLRVETDDEDALIASLCVAARCFAEKFCRRSFKVGDVWKLTLDRFPSAGLGNRMGLLDSDGGPEGVYPQWENEAVYLRSLSQRFAIEIPMGPVSAITSIVYIDPTGTSQTLDPSQYLFVPDDEANPKVYPSYGNWWPVTQLRPDAIAVTFTAGGPLPAPVLIAMQQLVAHWYANREAAVITPSTAQTVPFLCEALLWPYRLLEF